MTKQNTSAGRPVTASAPWGDLAERVGGIGKLAERLGVTRSTMNKWKLGTHRIPVLAKKEVIRLCKYYEITEGIETL